TPPIQKVTNDMETLQPALLEGLTQFETQFPEQAAIKTGHPGIPQENLSLLLSLLVSSH
ncbi:hypothetical protein Tco_0634247, partial [Tanacetum coccineum]